MAPSAGQVPMEHVMQSGAVDFNTALDTSSMADRTILITGGASGLGAGFFTRWAALGATVIIGDMNVSAGTSLVENTKSTTRNFNLYFLPLDVTSWPSQVAFFRQAALLSEHGGIDAVVANAGISGADESRAIEEPPDYTMLDDPPPPKLKTLDVNLTGVLYTTALATSYLARNPGSEKCSLQLSRGPRDRHLLLMASMAGLAPLTMCSVYAAAKHGVVGLFRSLRVRAPMVHGVRVNMLCPYFVDTPMLGARGASVLAGGGMAELEDVVEAGTRLVADTTVIGRGLAIGPKVSMQDANEVGFDVVEKGGVKQAIWDVHAHDFEQSDLFTRRVVGLTNLITQQRGVLGLMGDMLWLVATLPRRLLGI